MSEFIPRTVSATQGSSNSVATRWHPSGSGPREGGRRVAVGGGRGSRGITHFLRVHFLDLVDHTGDAAPEVVSKLVPATHTLRSGSPGLAADSERRCEIEHGHSAFAGGGPKRGVDAQSLAIWRVNRVPVEARDRHRRRLRHPGPVCAVRSTAEPVFRYGIAARIAVSDGVRRTTEWRIPPRGTSTNGLSHGLTIFKVPFGLSSHLGTRQRIPPLGQQRCASSPGGAGIDFFAR